MRLHLRVALPLMACIALSFGAYAQEKKPMTAADELLQVDIAWSKTTTTEEEDSYWAPEAKMLAPHQPLVEGKEAVIASFNEIRNLPGYGLTWQPTSAVVAESGDIGYTIGTYEMTLNDPDGEPIVDHGKYLTVWKRQADGAWKVSVDMFNTNMPAPAD